jgi:hypothetical protein
VRVAASFAALEYTVWCILTVYMMRHLLLSIGEEDFQIGHMVSTLTVRCVGILDMISELSKPTQRSLGICFV